MSSGSWRTWRPWKRWMSWTPLRSTGPLGGSRSTSSRPRLARLLQGSPCRPARGRGVRAQRACDPHTSHVECHRIVSLAGSLMDSDVGIDASDNEESGAVISSGGQVTARAPPPPEPAAMPLVRPAQLPAVLGARVPQAAAPSVPAGAVNSTLLLSTRPAQGRSRSCTLLDISCDPLLRSFRAVEFAPRALADPASQRGAFDSVCAARSLSRALPLGPPLARTDGSSTCGSRMRQAPMPPTHATPLRQRARPALPRAPSSVGPSPALWPPRRPPSRVCSRAPAPAPLGPRQGWALAWSPSPPAAPLRASALAPRSCRASCGVTPTALAASPTCSLIRPLHARCSAGCERGTLCVAARRPSRLSLPRGRGGAGEPLLPR